VNQDQQLSQSRRRPRYDEEFKRNAVELLERGERSAAQLGRGWMFRTVLKISGNVNMAGKSEQLAAPMEPTKAGSRNWSANWRRSVANATF